MLSRARGQVARLSAALRDRSWEIFDVARQSRSISRISPLASKMLCSTPGPS